MVVFLGCAQGDDSDVNALYIFYKIVTKTSVIFYKK